MSRMRADLTAGRSVTVAAGDLTLFMYAYGAPRPHLAGGRLPTPVTWAPPHADPGAARHVTFTELSATPQAATIAHHLRWPAVAEWRSLTTAPAGGDTWVLLLEHTVTNTSGAPLPLDGPPLALPAVTAPAAGRAEWRAARAAGCTVVVVDDSANLQHPPRWSAGLSPAPFEAGPVVLGADRTVAFRYAVVVAPAARPAPALAALGRDALTGPPPPRRGEICPGAHPRHRPVRPRTPVLARRCETRAGGAPPGV
ncbi:hypothetical protein [Actinoplanes teichomyceticus]|uniref:Uncharacterized protein n=1 Tax=Actinoplanes teichomyceticus TaxID=1867 RepID=A0A561VL18_ACTTI|nr:hypothetical protein [Actinoplanes teichomyceticus]TWG12287.1 hypothetical protein FHX34_105154 [Actinoplanes teichomyceticus]GIF14228.1 hypothetical protein Ate01nite_42600 [Actinoplanes teichomyceticus]